MFYLSYALCYVVTVGYANRAEKRNDKGQRSYITVSDF